MSYEKIKNIKIENNKVMINGASNNVRPLSYSYWECTPLSKILQEQGKEELDIEILKAYESGEFQGGTNKYTRALKVLYYLFKEEYKRFNWRNNWEESRKVLNTEEGKEEFKELLKKALNTKLPKKKFIITKPHYNSESGVVYGKVCPTCIKWNYLKEKATKFDFEEEAKNHIFEKYKDEWKVEEIKVFKNKKEKILNGLNNFHGTQQYYKSTFGKLKLTEGINYLRNKVNCYWLIDIVESVQHLKKIKENSFIVWKIEVKDNSFIVKAYSDIANTNSKDNKKYILYEQEGDYTDFPLKEFEFYQINDVLLLKGEY